MNNFSRPLFFHLIAEEKPNHAKEEKIFDDLEEARDYYYELKTKYNNSTIKYVVFYNAGNFMDPEYRVHTKYHSVYTRRPIPWVMSSQRKMKRHKRQLKFSMI